MTRFVNVCLALVMLVLAALGQAKADQRNLLTRLRGQGARVLQDDDRKKLKQVINPGAATGWQTRSLKHTSKGQPNDIALEGDKVVSCFTDGTIRIFSRSSGEEVKVIENQKCGTKLRASGDRAAYGSGSKLIIVNLESGEVEQDITTPSKVNTVKIDPAGVLAGGDDGVSRYYGACSGEAGREFRGHKDTVSSVHLSGDLAFTGSNDNTLIIHNRESGEKLATKNFGGDVNGIDTFDNTLAVATNKGMFLLDITDPKNPRDLNIPQADGTCWSPSISGNVFVGSWQNGGSYPAGVYQRTTETNAKWLKIVEGDVKHTFVSKDLVGIAAGNQLTLVTPPSGVTFGTDAESSTEASSCDGLSAGSIVGIVIGVIAAVVLLAGGAYYAKKRKAAAASSPPAAAQGGGLTAKFAAFKEAAAAKMAAAKASAQNKLAASKTSPEQ